MTQMSANKESDDTVTKRDSSQGVSSYEDVTKDEQVDTSSSATNAKDLAEHHQRTWVDDLHESERADFREKRSPDDLEHDIEQTQERIATHIDELTRRLNPTHIKDQAVNSLNESLNLPGLKYLLGDLKGGMGASVKSSGVKVLEGVKHNPISAALVGIGVGVVTVGGILAARTTNTMQSDTRQSNTRQSDSKQSSSDYKKPKLAKSTKARTYDERLRDMMTTIENKPKDSYETDSSTSTLGEKLQGAKDTVKDTVSEGAHYVSEKLQGAKETASEGAHYVGEKLQGAKETASEGAHYVGEKLQGAKETASEGAHYVGEKLQGAKESVMENVHHAKDATVHGAQRTKEGFGQLLQSQPLAVGAVALLAGAALGLLLPRTQYENSMMGEKSDELMSQAKGKASEVVEAAKETVGSVVQTAKETVGEVVQTAKDTARETVKAATA
jgi:Protein of unknown function (DUF3618)